MAREQTVGEQDTETGAKFASSRISGESKNGSHIGDQLASPIAPLRPATAPADLSSSPARTCRGLATAPGSAEGWGWLQPPWAGVWLNKSENPMRPSDLTLSPPVTVTLDDHSGGPQPPN